MVKVFYKWKTNAYLGGVMFLDGVAEFEDDAEGLEFATIMYLKYEVIEVKAKKVVKKDE